MRKGKTGRAPEARPPQKRRRCPSPPAAPSSGSSARSTAAAGSRRRAAAPLALPGLPSPSAPGFIPLLPVPGLAPPAHPVLGPARPRPARRSPGRGGRGVCLHGDHHAPGASRGCPRWCLHGGADAAHSRMATQREREPGGRGEGWRWCTMYPPSRGRLSFARSGGAGRPWRGGSFPAHIPAGSAAALPFTAILVRRRGGERGKRRRGGRREGVVPAMAPRAGVRLPGRSGWRCAEWVEGGMAPMSGGWSRLRPEARG